MTSEMNSIILLHICVPVHNYVQYPQIYVQICQQVVNSSS